jgi:hypothetical protein
MSAAAAFPASESLGASALRDVKSADPDCKLKARRARKTKDAADDDTPSAAAVVAMEEKHAASVTAAGGHRTARVKMLKPNTAGRHRSAVFIC